MWLRVFFLLLVVPLVLSVGPVRTLATSSSPSDLLILRGASARMGHQPVERVLRWLRAQPAVQRAERGRDGRTLDIYFRDGQEMLVLPAQFAAVQVARGKRGLLQPFSRMRQITGGRAAVLTPFASELGYAGTGDIEARDLQNTGFRVDQASDAAVTVSLMATLARYNVVYMHTHSGTTSGGDGVLATGQLTNGDPSVAPFLQDGSVVPVGVAGDDVNNYYAVTSRFFAYHVAPFPHDSLLFLNGCKLLPATVFWQALSAKGAGAMVSWSEDAQAKDDYLSGAGFFNFLAQGMSIDAAIVALKASGFGTSEYAGTTATLGFRGDGSITLSRAARGRGPAATATSTPPPSRTQTSIAASPTSTHVVPVPTATRPSLPPLTIAGLRRTIAPKQAQHITVRTVAGILVALSVRFPDGRHLSEAKTADGSGAAAFSFTQPRNSITRHENRADVSVVAGRGAEARSLVDSYTIGYDVIDLSIEPREARPGSSVALWVHTGSRTAVEGRVTAPQRKPAVMHGKTGSDGWARLVYRVPGGLTPGQRVSVSVAAQRQGKSVKTSAKLVVR